MDLDRGGTPQAWERAYLGPSIGWVRRPGDTTLPITAAGTYIIDPAISLVTVRVAAAVTLILPSTVNPLTIAQPGLSVDNTITIVDIGGNASTNPITIQPQAGDAIAGGVSMQISTAYGSVVLLPSSPSRQWTLV